MTNHFTADMMDLNPSLHSSGFFQAIMTHSAMLAVSPLRPANGLNDLDVCLSSLRWIVAVAHPGYFSEYGIHFNRLALSSTSIRLAQNDIMTI